MIVSGRWGQPNRYLYLLQCVGLNFSIQDCVLKQYNNIRNPAVGYLLGFLVALPLLAHPLFHRSPRRVRLVNWNRDRAIFRPSLIRRLQSVQHLHGEHARKLKHFYRTCFTITLIWSAAGACLSVPSSAAQILLGQWFYRRNPGINNNGQPKAAITMVSFW